MKREYLEPTIDVIRFQTEDIMNLSGVPGPGDDHDNRPGIELPDVSL